MQHLSTTASSSSSDSPAPPEGLALVCDAQGRIVSAPVQTVEGSAVSGVLCEAVDTSTAETCRVFLSTIRRGGLTRSTPLRIGSRDLHCFGSCRNDVLRVVAVIDPASAAPFAEHAAAAAGDPEFLELAREIRRAHSTYELYEELARLNNDLVTTQRELARTVSDLQRLNAYKDELLGMAAHDLRNPLHVNSSIISFLMDGQTARPESDRKLLERLSANSRYMTRLVDSVLDFAAIESGRVRLEREDASVDQVIRSVVEMLQIIAAGKEIQIRYDADSPANLSIDPVKVGEAVQNIISNAVQYSPPGSAIDVRVRERASEVVIEIEDRGPGIKASAVPLLFQPFQRLAPAKGSRQKSVGLGLAITKRLIEAHDGTIDVISEIGLGTTFVVKLPRR